MRLVTDDERRARLATRLAVAPAARLPDVESATRAIVALHATEPASVYLSALARVRDGTLADVDAALYDNRTIVKQLAMRRTMFAFPRDLLGSALVSASARVAGSEWRGLAKALLGSGVTTDADAWLQQARAEVLALIERVGPVQTSDVRAAVPMLAGTVTVSPGSKWGGEIPVAPRVLTLLGARGEIVRGHNEGHFRLSRYRWTSMADWLGEPISVDDSESQPTSEAGYAELVRRWLFAFGPGTEADLVWWLGSTKTAVRAALHAVEALPVQLADGSTGYLLPDDLAPVTFDEPWAALLPVLDPATMGWRGRDWYLDPAHVPYLFDSNGNGGTTAWLNGRIVGCYVQDPDGTVRLSLREDVDPTGRDLLQIEADRLTALLDGHVVNSVYASQQMRGERLP